MNKQLKAVAFTTAAAGAAVMMAVTPASAAVTPGASTIVAKSSTPNTATSSLAGWDARRARGCTSGAYLLGRVTYHLGRVTATSVELKSFDLELTGGKVTQVGGIRIARGTDGKQVWGNPWSIPPYTPSRTQKKNYPVNKVIPAGEARAKAIQLTVYWNVSQARGGEPADCWGQGDFIFKVRPGRFTYNEPA
ncbi:hypothetical protein [Streptomyces sp. NRRL S-87]|uniref:hypothetical protein n=1 Tax=Streptomyces sp. NRRL S-87 TaxID=1463920 RepID=UPI0004BF942D|nr:hypothetical protein [Streptomyces sp. NRRL S-87]